MKIKYIGVDNKGDSLYTITLTDGTEHEIEVCDGTVFPTTLLTPSEQKEVINFHYNN